jgi:signal transduction histidine kinase
MAVLAAPWWHEANLGAGSSRPAAASASGVGAPPAPAGALILSQRLALALAGMGLALTLPLVFARPVAAEPPVASRAPLEGARREVSTLARLAENSVAQGEALSRERDVRRRAEEDMQLKQQLLNQSIDDKVRLGRDLHDGIIQSLYAAGLTLESVRSLLQRDPVEAERRLDQVRTSLNGAIRDVRACIAGLAPDQLRRAGFARALASVLEELRGERPTRLDLQIDEPAAAELGPEPSLEVLQIAREAVSNALRHGQASLITVRMHQGDGAICLLIQDDGRGFDETLPREDGRGHGNMRARADRLGATLRISSQPGRGTRVLVTVPRSCPAPP